MSPLEQLLASYQPYPIRFAAAVTRGLPPPECEVPVGTWNARTFTRWTAELDAWVRREYGPSRGQLIELARRMGVSVVSLYSRAAKLGLQRSGV